MNEMISVLMTVYNSEKYVLNSVESILLQKYKNFELIIVDDLSTDNTVSILKKIKDERIKFYPMKEKLGRTKALNFALSKSNSNIIAIQDADDVSDPYRFEISLKKMNSEKSIGLISTNFNFIDSEGKQEKIKNKLQSSRDNIDNLKILNFIPHSSIIFKRNVFQKNLFYDETFIYSQDYKLILDYFKNSKIYLMNEKLVYIRKHDKNMTNKKEYKKIIIEENIKILNYISRNFELKILERFQILFFKLKNFFKLIIHNND